MANDPERIERLTFGSKVIEIGEDEFGATFSGDPGKALMDMLFRLYVEAGKPRDAKNWLRTQLAQCFVCVNDRPRWIEDSSSWPYFDGKPMVFIQQLAIKDGPVSSDKLATNVDLYIFGAKKKLADSWEMHYEVVEQHYALASQD